MNGFSITDDDAQFFEQNGYLIVRGVIAHEELKRLREATDELIGYGSAAVRDDPDYMYAAGHRTGEPVLRRIEYVVDKRDECKVLLGHPFILRSVERLVGPDLIPTWDSMVLKMPGEGIVVPWHRDAGTGCVGDKPIFNADFYIDEANEDTCVWVIPGSHLWTDEQAQAFLSARRSDVVDGPDFLPQGAIPALMQRGDVLFHNILLMHGSPANNSPALRRVIYYEFRTAHVEDALGPHTREYIPLKQQVLLACVQMRRRAGYVAPDEQPFRYDPPAPYDGSTRGRVQEPLTYRYPHQDYWRPSAWTPELTMRVPAIGQVRVDPDGGRVIYSVTSAVMTDDISEMQTQLVLAASDGTGVRPLTAGPKSSRNGQWSPDGTRIAFLSNRAGKYDLYLIPPDGGEAERITESSTDISDFRWSPDGRWIAYTRADAPTPDEGQRAKGKDDWRWVDEAHKYIRLYLAPVQADAAGRREARLLTSGELHVADGFDWAPNGQSILFACRPTPSEDDWTKSRICSVDIRSCEVTDLTTSRACRQPLCSPDGSMIACVMSDDPPSWADDSAIAVIGMPGGAPRIVGETFDSRPTLVGWSPDGARIYFSEAAGTSSRLSAMGIETGHVTHMSEGTGLDQEFHLDPSLRRLGFTRQAPDRPVEAWTGPAQAFRPVRVSPETSGVPDLPVGRTEVIRWHSADGREIEGLLTYPTGYANTRRVPLLLIVHGGPAGVFQQSFIASPMRYPVAVFAARGYAVLRANPRGSSGYGKAFRFANVADWGGGDYVDLMAGVDHVIEQGVADGERLGVMGWSYGGYMTAWIISHTDRFKAASVGAGVTNLWSFNGTADIPGFLPSYFGGTPWDRLDTYLRHSPLFGVDRIGTPTLIQHPEEDARVPITQGYELYGALKARGVETRMLVLPREVHVPEEPRMVLKVMQTNLEWFERFVPVGA